MKTMTTSATSTHFAALAVLLVAGFAIAAVAVFALARPAPVPVQPAGSMQQSRITELRNRRLLELNEGIKPVVTAVPVDRNRRLLELNEGYAPTPWRSPRDQRLYELNR